MSLYNIITYSVDNCLINISAEALLLLLMCPSLQPVVKGWSHCTGKDKHAVVQVKNASYSQSTPDAIRIIAQV